MSKYYYSLKEDEIVRDVCTLIEKTGYTIDKDMTFPDGTWLIIYINEKKRACVVVDSRTIDVNARVLIRWGDAEIKDGKLFDNWSKSFIEF